MTLPTLMILMSNVPHVFGSYFSNGGLVWGIYVVSMAGIYGRKDGLPFKDNSPALWVQSSLIPNPPKCVPECLKLWVPWIDPSEPIVPSHHGRLRCAETVSQNKPLT